MIRSIIQQISLFKQEAKTIQEEERVKLHNLLTDLSKELENLEKDYHKLENQLEIQSNQYKELLCKSIMK